MAETKRREARCAVLLDHTMSLSFNTTKKIMASKMRALFLTAAIGFLVLASSDLSICFLFFSPSRFCGINVIWMIELVSFVYWLWWFIISKLQLFKNLAISESRPISILFIIQEVYNFNICRCRGATTKRTLITIGLLMLASLSCMASFKHNSDGNIKSHITEEVCKNGHCDSASSERLRAWGISTNLQQRRWTNNCLAIYAVANVHINHGVF